MSLENECDVHFVYGFTFRFRDGRECNVARDQAAAGSLGM